MCMARNVDKNGRRGAVHGLGPRSGSKVSGTDVHTCYTAPPYFRCATEAAENNENVLKRKPENGNGFQPAVACVVHRNEVVE